MCHFLHSFLLPFPSQLSILYFELLCEFFPVYFPPLIPLHQTPNHYSDHFQYAQIPLFAFQTVDEIKASFVEFILNGILSSLDFLIF